MSEVLPFAAVTVNMGPTTVCDPHIDGRDLVWGWCMVFALGSFNSKHGGHLVLHEAKLIIEFGPGDIVFFPSGCVTHENIPIGAEEERYSITFYSAGDLFRYRDMGFRTVVSVNRHEYQAYEAGGDKRWEDGCSRYLTKAQVLERVKAHKPQPNGT